MSYIDGILLTNAPDPAIELEILRQGSVYASDLSNALSPHGIAMWSAFKKGLLRYAGRKGAGSVYKITQQGRAIVEQDRMARLAEIGVFEVRT